MGTGYHCYGNYRTENTLAMEGQEREMFQKKETAARLGIETKKDIMMDISVASERQTLTLPTGAEISARTDRVMVVRGFGYRMSFYKKTIRTLNGMLAYLTRRQTASIWLQVKREGCRYCDTFVKQSGVPIFSSFHLRNNPVCTISYEFVQTRTSGLCIRV